MGAFAVEVEIVSFGCCWSCGVPVYGPSVKHAKCKESGHNFFCINGHPAVFKESEAAKYKRLAEQETKRREWAEQSAKKARHAESIARGKLKAHATRVKNGVCPCCNRSFQNLRRHMETKHPDFATEVE